MPRTSLFRRSRFRFRNKERWRGVKIHATIAGIVGFSLVLQQPRATLLLGGALCFVTYLYLGLLETRHTPIWLSPLSFFFFWYSIGMGVSPFYVALVTDSDGLVRFATEATMVSLSALAYAYFLFLLASLALHVGMLALRPEVRAESKEDLSPRLTWWFGLIWAVGLLFQLQPGLFTGLGSVTRLLSIALVGSVCGFAVTRRVDLKLSVLGFAVVLVVGTAGLFFGNLASGSKAYIMFSFLPVTWLFITSQRLRLWSLALGGCLALFYFAVVAPVVYTSRRIPLEEGQDPREHMIRSFDVWLRERPEEISESFFLEQFDQFANRQFDSVPVGFIVGEVNRSGLLLGDTMKYASYAFIPRVLWPEKPGVTRGAWFSTYLGLSQIESDATTSVGMTAVGEFYWNFGALGVIGGMLLIGLVQGYLWRMAGADPRGRPIQMLLYVSIMLSLTDMPEAITVFASLTVTLLTFKGLFFALTLLRRNGIVLLPAPSHRAAQ